MVLLRSPGRKRNVIGFIQGISVSAVARNSRLHARCACLLPTSFEFHGTAVAAAEAFTNKDI
jgi:hypothetical protein